MRNDLRHLYRHIILILLFVNLVTVSGKTQTKSFEFSGHFTTLNVGEYAPGFGATLAYNLNRRIALESTLNFFPGDPRTNLGRSIRPLGDLNTGKILQGQFGVRATVLHLRMLDLFVKAKPGFVSFSDLRNELQSGIGGTGNPLVVWDAGRQTGFAMDVGGGAELSTIRNTVLRLDAGDTYFQYPSLRSGSNLQSGAGVLPVFAIPGTSVHTFQVSVGVAYRFGGTK